MTPLPGPRDGSAGRGAAEAVRQVFAALLLAVLTVVGGAPVAVGFVSPARSFSGVPPSVAYSPGAHQPTPHTDRSVRAGTVHDTRRARSATAADRHRVVPTAAPQPRAGTDHARSTHHLPPHGPEFLLPGAPGVRVPHPAPPPAPAAPPRAFGCFRGALPVYAGLQGRPSTGRRC
ncbi:hypothetical protein [Streptomyces sp. NBC_01217]|uniref:hypothetical protein n=1 Tax=Streptomyces sp. NBC_01217 TaxID=2903779 RepID=UPI002E0D77A5|nr:hypothetical protein OG507_35975 [Streptomyces sp. NBC_01217]